MNKEYAILGIFAVGLAALLCACIFLGRNLHNDHQRSMNTEELRDDLRRVVDNYPSATIAEILGVLELLKFEFCRRLETCSHPDAEKKGNSAKPDSTP